MSETHSRHRPTSDNDRRWQKKVPRVASSVSAMETRESGWLPIVFHYSTTLKPALFYTASICPSSGLDIQLRRWSRTLLTTVILMIDFTTFIFIFVFVTFNPACSSWMWRNRLIRGKSWIWFAVINTFCISDGASSLMITPCSLIIYNLFL